MPIGLDSGRAAALLTTVGRNALPEATQRSAFVVLLHQFRSLIVLLLAVAGGVAAWRRDFVEAGAILVVILLNAAIGFATEWKAARALAGLRKREVARARVLRDGEEREIPAEELVPGDVVLLAEGDRVPADGRLHEAVRLRLDEAALTGESSPVSKSVDAAVRSDAPLAERGGDVHMGTVVTDGRGVFEVTATGARTQMGKIGALVSSVGARETPLEGKLAQLGRALLVVVLALCGVIVLVGWLRGIEILRMVEVGTSLAIAAVPEGLLAVTTMTLAVGMQRMAAMRALVRRLPAVEALGSTTVICSDKTGTLTRNEMTVRALDVAGLRVEVTGTGYAADGELTLAGRKLGPDDTAVALALRIGALCNDARLDRTATGGIALGDPTEAALLVAAEKGGLDRDALMRAHPRVTELPFDSKTKRMVTVHGTPDGKTVAYVKGAPAEVLEASVSEVSGAGTTPLSVDGRARLLAANEALAGQALRVLAFAYRELPSPYVEADLTRELVFVGLVGMIDPLRDEAPATILACRGAGIRAIMITGDQQATAAEIARQIGIDVDGQGRPLRTVHARELDGLDASGWLAIVEHAGVFARVSPEHKLNIVDALQRRGHVVAMTGDGVNDAPALRKADIGIAMGIRGTEVAKEASAMVITDDNFATIVGAVEQGRIVVHNILRFIHYLFSCNFAEILTVFVAILIGWPLPLGVLEILWLNLVTDVFPAMALALEPSAPDVMKRPPRDPKEPLMTLRFAGLIVWQGALLAAVTLAAFAIALRWYGSEGPGVRHAETVAFMTLAFVQTVHTFSARSQTGSALTSRIFANRWLWIATGLCVLLQLCAVYVPPLRAVLGTVALGWMDWAVVGVASVVPLAVIELVKLGSRASRRRAARD